MNPESVTDDEKIVGVPFVVHDNQMDDNSDNGVSNHNLVDFEGIHDAEDPQNWSPLYKWSMVILISLLSLIV